MNAVEQGDARTGPQLAAQLAALRGGVPEPARFALFRTSIHADGSRRSGYELPDPPTPAAERDWPQWLREHGLLGDNQLLVAVLVIHETLDPAGRIAECVLERRRGAADGPLFGQPARVEFVGPARMLRFYRLDRNGQLQEFAPSPRLLPPRPGGTELLAGERLALERRFGGEFQVIDTREPTLFEDMAGLATIAHVWLPSGQELACGIGWHGTQPFTLVADFPRLALPPRLPPPDDAALQQALRRHRLVRYESRLDERGVAVMAHRPGSAELFQLRCVNGQVDVERYRSGRIEQASEDQRQWLRFVQQHEELAELDYYRDGASDNLVVLTGDAFGQVQQHLVDPDGVELWRRTADDTAVAALYRERMPRDGAAPPDAMTTAAVSAPLVAPPGHPAPTDSVLAAVLAVNDALAAVTAARGAAEAGDGPDAMAEHLRAALQACEVLAAEHTASRIVSLLSDVENDSPDAPRLLPELGRLETGLHDELGLLRLLLLQPAEWRRLGQHAPFGAEVEAGFPGCAYDIEEAARCLALHRPTAAMFHCMRVLQRGIAAFARHAKVAEPDGSWAAILSQLGAACPASLAGALGALRRLRRRWRAPGLLPAEKYTEAEAELAFRGLGVFLRELAAQCDEEGRASGN